MIGAPPYACLAIMPPQKGRSQQVSQVWRPKVALAWRHHIGLSPGHNGEGRNFCDEASIPSLGLSPSFPAPTPEIRRGSEIQTLPPRSPHWQGAPQTWRVQWILGITCLIQHEILRARGSTGPPPGFLQGHRCIKQAVATSLVFIPFFLRTQNRTFM